MIDSAFAVGIVGQRVMVNYRLGQLLLGKGDNDSIEISVSL